MYVVEYKESAFDDQTCKAEFSDYCEAVQHVKDIQLLHNLNENKSKIKLYETTELMLEERKI